MFENPSGYNLLVAHLRMGSLLKIHEGKSYLIKAKGLNAGKDMEVSLGTVKRLFRARMLKSTCIFGKNHFYKIK